MNRSNPNIRHLGLVVPLVFLEGCSSIPEPSLKEGGLYEIRNGHLYISEPNTQEKSLVIPERKSVEYKPTPKIQSPPKSNAVREKLNQIKRLSEKPP